MDKVGRDGVITVEESKTRDTTLETIEGMHSPWLSFTLLYYRC